MEYTLYHLWKTLGRLVLGCCLLQGVAITAIAQKTEEHFNVGLTYPISSNGTRAGSCTNTFSLHAAVGLSASEKGLSLAGVSNVILDSAMGLQIAGFSNHIRNSAAGIQIAGFMNLTGSSTGVNVAGFGNLSRRNSSGLQVAGFINKAANAGTQVAGFINIAKKVKGLQIAGLINIADSSDYPIGIINIIKSGEKSIVVSTDETLTTLVAFRSGGRQLYGIAGIGYNNKGSRALAAWEAGVGWRLINWGSFRLSTELVSIGLTDFKNGDCFRSSLRVLPALRLNRRMEIFAGPSFNYLHSHKGQGADLVSHYLWSDHKQDKEVQGLYFGFTGGVGINF